MVNMIIIWINAYVYVLSDECVLNKLLQVGALNLSIRSVR